MSRKVYIENMPLDEARKRWMSHLDSLGFCTPQVETIPVHNALNRITGEADQAKRSAPH